MTIALQISACSLTKMAENDNEESMEAVVGTIMELSDIDVVINYCLQNKIAKSAIDELLKQSLPISRLCN